MKVIKLSNVKYAQSFLIFIYYRNPTPRGRGPVNWEPVTAWKMQYLNIDTKSTMVTGSYSDKMQFWNEKLYN